MPEVVPLRWRILRTVLWIGVRRICRAHLSVRQITLDSGKCVRWLRPDLEAFVSTLRHEVEALQDESDLVSLPDTGSRVMAELAIHTLAADVALRRHNIHTRCAHAIVADIGWGVYRRLLLVTSLPVRLVTQNPRRRLRWTIRVLLAFPFHNAGAPGYAVEVRDDDDALRTYFRHCPPQTLVREAARRRSDPELLQGFRNSWCLYDWPGADLIVADDRRGHYQREHTLSHGDKVCDMCWSDTASGLTTHGNAVPPGGGSPT